MLCRAVLRAVLTFVTAAVPVAGTMAQVPQHSASRVLGTVSVASLSVPYKAWKHFEKARHAANTNHEEECRQEIDKALEIAPRFVEAYLLRAQRNAYAHQYQAVIDDALRAQEIDPTTVWARILVAIADNGLERYDDAYVVLSNLHGSDADTWQARYEMARAEVGRGDVEGALHWSELALAAAPASMIDAHLLRANALQLAHRWAEATKEMEVYLASSGPQPRRDAVLAAISHIRLLADGSVPPPPR